VCYSILYRVCCISSESGQGGGYYAPRFGGERPGGS
jgi:hypothetical protein